MSMDIQAVIKQESASISCNFEQVEKAIQERIAQYENIAFTEESKTCAKKEVASLREEKKNFQENLRAEKKKYMAPWDAFETQAKILIGMYDTPISLINDQLQTFEKKRIAEKKDFIKQLYEEYVPDDVKEYIPLDRIYNPKWENATVKKKLICDEMYSAATSVQNAVNTIQMMNSEVVEKALQMYKRDLSLTNAISYINNYERQKQEILVREQERQRKEAEKRIRREEREKFFAEQKAKEEKEEILRQAEMEKTVAVEQARKEGAEEAISIITPDSEPAKTVFYNYQIALSDDAKEKLEMYMDSVGIEWRLML